MSFDYLASNYSNPDDRSDFSMCQERYEAVCKAAARLMREGRKVFSPIAHSHGIANYMDSDLRSSHSFWLDQDFAILRHAGRLIVLMLPGWDKSKGIAEEMAFARRHGIPVAYMRADDATN